jgi:hypothetical protein
MISREQVAVVPRSKSNQFGEKAESYSIKDWCPFTQAPNNLLLRRLHRRPAGRKSCRFALEISVQQRATKRVFWMSRSPRWPMAPAKRDNSESFYDCDPPSRQIAIARCALAQEHDQDNEGNRDSD